MKEKAQFWNIWSSYATYYFARVNLSIAVPALLAAQTGLTLWHVGIVTSCAFAAYSLGQFLHGQLSERYNPFVYVAIGLLGSGIINLSLGFWGGYFALLLVGQVIDGLFESMGWSSCVRANAIVSPDEKRSRRATLLGTSYQAGNSIAWLVSAYAIGLWGWRAGFFVAAGLLILRGLILLWTHPSLPQKVLPRNTFVQIRKTLTKPIVLSGIALGLLNMTRYGIISWVPLYLFEQQNLVVAQMGKVGLTVCLMPLAGILGTLCYTRLQKHGKLWAGALCFFLAASTLLLLVTSGWTASLLLMTAGFCLYGPHVYLVTTFPTKYASQNLVAASTGFIDGCGYIGTFLVGIMVPALMGFGGWVTIFGFWALAAALAGIVILFAESALARQRGSRLLKKEG